MAKMPGKEIPTCCFGDRCCNAHDSVGKKQERRVAKRREKQKARAEWISEQSESSDQ